MLTEVPKSEIAPGIATHPVKGYIEIGEAIIHPVKHFKHMLTRLTPHLIDLIFDAALKSFWRKPALKRFLNNANVPRDLLASWDESESKRTFLDRLFDSLRKHTEAESIFATLSKSLAEQTAFPDLMGWEDTTEKLAEATRSVARLKEYVAEQDRQLEDQAAQIRAREKFAAKQAEMRKAQHSLSSLQDALAGLVPSIGTQKAGYQFQDWFYNLMDFFEVISRRPYTTDGRQIDGAVTLKDTTYLVELKFTSTPSAPDDIDSLIRKVSTKADNTLGLFVSMSGFTNNAIEEAGRNRTLLLLIDFNHIYHILGGRMSFPDLIDRAKRHASQTGQSYLHPNAFNG